MHVVIDAVVVVEEIVVVVLVVSFLENPKFQASANAVLAPMEGTMIFQGAIGVGGALVVETDDGVKVVNVVFSIEGSFSFKIDLEK